VASGAEVISPDRECLGIFLPENARADHGPMSSFRPLGITIIGGLLVSQILTLDATPVIYLFRSPQVATGAGGDPSAGG
jgi:hypothetical protein